MYYELFESSDEDTLPMRETPMPQEVFETSDWASTQIALEAALVVFDLQGAIIHELRGKIAALDIDISQLTAAAASHAITSSKQQIFDTAVKLESATISAKQILI
ncbi:unnamed protein product [Echinostoma caproni]|uniref:Phasin_2 domain-containing protein n=1 Tax=Echinostoma caproni TaxID=27848 RepID=A0A183B1A4_9TREM|nr:unnamed protein product [Echinostoma caproni]